jgi:NitT/TauT family transport system substrate-binding protein
MVRAVMPLYSVSPLAVGVLGSSGIKKLSDLEGKTIAAAPGDSAVLILPVAFEKAGADFSKVKIQTVEMATLTGLLVQGKVDAITTYVMTAMLIDKAAQQAGKSVETLDFGKDLGIYSNSILTSDAVIAAQPDLVKRFREAATCAYVKTNADLPAAVEAMNRAVTGMDVALQIAIAKASLPLILGSPAYGKFGFGWDPAMVATTLAVATKAQGIKTDADPMSFVVSK